MHNDCFVQEQQRTVFKNMLRHASNCRGRKQTQTISLHNQGGDYHSMANEGNVTPRGSKPSPLPITHQLTLKGIKNVMSVLMDS